MADSNITKRALANSLKSLMTEQPFEKINVAQICERCDMNRKSFYYHFKDKYDLVNWIFEATPTTRSAGPVSRRFASIFIRTTDFTVKHFKSRGKIPSVSTSGNISAPFWPTGFSLCSERSGWMNLSWTSLPTR